MNDRADRSLGEFACRVLVFVLIVGLAMLAWRLADILLLAFIFAAFTLAFRWDGGTIRPQQSWNRQHR